MGHAFEDQEIDASRENCESEKDETEGEENVTKVLLKSAPRLEWYVITEANGAEGDDDVIEGIEDGPSLVLVEDEGAHRNGGGTDGERHEKKVFGFDLRENLDSMGSQEAPESEEAKTDESVDSLAHRLKHDERERDPDEGEDHTK